MAVGTGVFYLYPGIMGTKNSPFNFGLPRYACVAVGIAATKSSSFSGILKRSGDQVGHFPEAFRHVRLPHTRKSGYYFFAFRN
jgi:hypothetical protein